MNTHSELSGLFDQFENKCRYEACLRPETIRGYKESFKLFSKIMPEIVDPKDLSQPAITEFAKRLSTRQRKVGKSYTTGVKPSTIRTYLTKLKAFTAWLVSNGYMAKNPMDTVTMPQVRYDDHRKLTDSDMDKIHGAIVQNQSNQLLFRRDLAMVALLVYTGIRKGELLGLQLKDVDLGLKKITIRKHTSKSKRDRTIPLHATAVARLKEYLHERKARNFKNEHLFVSSRRDTPITDHGLKHWVERISKISGIKLHMHRFRHTFACRLVERNTNISNVQKLMGHQSLEMTAAYLRSMVPEDMAEDIAKLPY